MDAPDVGLVGQGFRKQLENHRISQSRGALHGLRSAESHSSLDRRDAVSRHHLLRLDFGEERPA